MTELVLISSLTLDPKNARKHSKKNIDAIKGSLKRFGQQKPIVVSEDNIILAGNGTLEAAKALGWDKIEIQRSQLVGNEAKAFALADNRSAELAEWEDAQLSEALKTLQDDEFDLNEIGFSDDDLKNLISDVPDFDPGSIEDQGKLDEKKKTQCPNCHYEFET